jgi:hypothetical protein
LIYSTRKVLAVTTLYSEERLARIMRLIEQYEAKQQRLRLQRASKVKMRRLRSTVPKST